MTFARTQVGPDHPLPTMPRHKHLTPERVKQIQAAMRSQDIFVAISELIEAECAARAAKSR